MNGFIWLWIGFSEGIWWWRRRLFLLCRKHAISSLAEWEQCNTYVDGRYVTLSNGFMERRISIMKLRSLNCVCPTVWNNDCFWWSWKTFRRKVVAHFETLSPFSHGNTKETHNFSIRRCVSSRKRATDCARSGMCNKILLCFARTSTSFNSFKPLLDTACYGVLLFSLATHLESLKRRMALSATGWVNRAEHSGGIVS
jgi:hypothetical protein